ncbi:hypothetical protein CRM89_29935 [Nocardia sp. FDAARGOS_372]|uniref:Uncharacterized protein n=2 Tax=Nocardiaceae TaxID=85025 RepID=Q5YM49_NOCFA|nr:hypothetical protein CRM89_29935 [Nocardia sp. FDAARGOS_372]BAD60742.1 hypothetical protein PNF2_560 [Nocardia farcinica IFM 10152]
MPGRVRPALLSCGFMSNERVYLTPEAAASLPHTLPLQWDSNRPTICHVDVDAAVPQDNGWLRIVLSQNEGNQFVLSLPPTAVAAVVWVQGAMFPTF